MVECDKVEYDTQRIDQDADIDKCIPEQWRGFFRNMHQGHEPLLKKLADDLVSKGQALNNDRSSFDVKKDCEHTARIDCVSPGTCFSRYPDWRRYSATIVRFDTLSHRFKSGINSSN